MYRTIYLLAFITALIMPMQASATWLWDGYNAHKGVFASDAGTEMFALTMYMPVGNTVNFQNDKSPGANYAIVDTNHDKRYGYFRSPSMTMNLGVELYRDAIKEGVTAFSKFG